MSNKINAQVFHYDLQGKREAKYDFLNENSLTTIAWNKLEPNEPNYFLTVKDDQDRSDYENGFSTNDLLQVGTSGIKTERDTLVIQFSKTDLNFYTNDLINSEVEDFRKRHKMTIDGRDWKLELAKEDLIKNNPQLIKIHYRPFDFRYSFYTGKTKGFQAYPRKDVTRNFVKKENLGLIHLRQNNVNEEFVTLITNVMTEKGSLVCGNYYISPLYLYTETNGQLNFEQSTGRKPNLNTEIVNQIAEKLGLIFVDEKTSPTPPKEGLSQPGYVTANPKNYLLIKEMRDNLKDNPTEAEKVMWEYLRNKKTGYKIRRQHIIDNFITDFVCLSKKIVIEIDGKIHLKQKEYDELRTTRLNDLGYEVLRYTNEEVFANPDLVALKIKEELDSISDLQIDEDAISPPLEGSGEVFAPIDILDYIYAVLHSPTYREKYKEFLKLISLECLIQKM